MLRFNKISFFSTIKPTSILFTSTSTNKMTTEQPTKWFLRWTKEGGEFPPEANRYHINHNYGCPFSCRAIVVRHLCGLDDKITVANFAPWYDLSYPNAKEGDKYFGHESWVFDQNQNPGDKLVDAKCPITGGYSAHEAYLKGCPEGAKFEDYQDDFTVPFLIDGKTKQVVNSESYDIVKMLWCDWKNLWSAEAKKYIEENNIELFPEENSDLGKEVQKALDKYQNGITFGLYSVGYAESQEEYNKNLKAFYDCMEDLEKLLDTRRFVAGSKLTFADLSLAMALVRFDLAYYIRFRFSWKRLKDYKNVHAYMCDIVNLLKINESAYVPDHIVQIYYGKKIDPKRTDRFTPPVPFDADFTKEQLTQHGRDTRKY